MCHVHVPCAIVHCLRGAHSIEYSAVSPSSAAAAPAADERPEGRPEVDGPRPPYRPPPLGAAPPDWPVEPRPMNGMEVLVGG